MSSLVGLINCVCWGLFAILKCSGVDFNILIPNAIGIPFFIIQIFTWWYFYSKANPGGSNIESKLLKDEEN